MVHQGSFRWRNWPMLLLASLGGLMTITTPLRGLLGADHYSCQ